MSKNELTFYGGVGAVTGANFFLQSDEKKFLIDCGLVQGSNSAESENNSPFQFDPAEIDYLFVTHAHMDHIGRIPKLIRDGFVGTIFSTEETRSIARPMLEDALYIMRHDKKIEIYDEADIERSFHNWKTLEYHSVTRITDKVSVKVFDAGHILGSAIYEFYLDRGSKTISFTGDLGNSPSPLLRDAEVSSDPQYLVIESVYGDRNHESKEMRSEKFKKAILENFHKGGVLLIPAFSIERSQVLLSELNTMVEHRFIPNMPVYFDSPLAIAVTEIYKRSKNFKPEVLKEMERDDIFQFPNLKTTRTRSDSDLIDEGGKPKIIIAGSGMSLGGRILKHEKKYLGEAKNTLLLVGYQSPGSIGRRLIDGDRKIKIDGEEIVVRAKIDKIDGYSAHMDSDHLLEYVEKSSPNGKLKKVFVCMGEPKSSAFLAQRIRDYLDIEAIVPERGSTWDL